MYGGSVGWRRARDGTETASRTSMGSPNNWRVNASEERELIEFEDGGLLDGEMEVRAPLGQIAGERRSIERYCFTDGCPGCDFKKAGMKAQRPHKPQCRERVEEEAGRTSVVRR